MLLNQSFDNLSALNSFVVCLAELGAGIILCSEHDHGQFYYHQSRNEVGTVGLDLHSSPRGVQNACDNRVRGNASWTKAKVRED